MKRIAIERYDLPNAVGFSGLIEGTRDDGSTWIMWLDNHGSPALFFAARDETGATLGDPVLLPPYPGAHGDGDEEEEHTSSEVAGAREQG